MLKEAIFQWFCIELQRICCVGDTVQIWCNSPKWCFDFTDVTIVFSFIILLCYTSDETVQKGWALKILKFTISLFQQRKHWFLHIKMLSILFCGNCLIIDPEFMSYTRKLTRCFMFTCNFRASVNTHCASRK